MTRAAMLAVVAGLASVLSAVSGADTATRDRVDVWFDAPRAEPQLQAVAMGASYWLANRIDVSGVRVAMSRSQQAAGSGSPAARAAGARAIVSVYLDRVDDKVELVALVHLPGTEQPAAVARASAGLSAIGNACESVAVELLSALGAPNPLRSSATPPRLDELASSGEALLHRDAGRLVESWKEVTGKLSPTAARIRDAIAAEARDPASEIAAAQRARVLCASGEPGLAWELVSKPVSRTPIAKLGRDWLAAAADVRLCQNKPRDARTYVDELVRREPERASTQLLLADTLRAQADPVGAARALARAVELGESDPRSLTRLADAASTPPKLSAQLMLRAGRTAAHQLDVHRAERFLERAAELDPAASSDAWLARAELRARIGLHHKALEAYQRAESRTPGPGLLVGQAHSQRALGDLASAEKSLRRAMELEPDRPDTLRELGSLLVAAGRAREAVPLLERAVNVAPSDAGSRRSLARSLQAIGDDGRALEVLRAGEEDSAELLAAAAGIHRKKGDLEAARYAILRAIERAPHDASLRVELSEIQMASGDSEAAQRESRLAGILGGSYESSAAGGEAAVARELPSLDEFIASFADGAPRSRQLRVTHLGLRNRPNWRGRLFDWLHPRSPDRDGIAEALDRAIGDRFALVSFSEFESTLGPFVDPLYRFERDESLDGPAIAKLNQLLGTDAVFLSRLDRAPLTDAEKLEAGMEPTGCDGGFEIDVRMLGGQDVELLAILANTLCLPDGLAAHSEPNRRAIAIYCILGLLALFPLLRGWGTLEVRIHMPPNTKGFFAIRVGKKPGQLEQAKRKKKDRPSNRLQRSLRSFSRFERRMAGRESLFRWLPARRAEYFVTVKGPLIDSKTEEIIGHFLEERTIAIRRGKRASLEFDFRPKECALEVHVMRAGQPEPQAQVAVRGDPDSLRYTRNGVAYLYLGIGEYEIAIGSGASVAVCPVDIKSLDKPIPLMVDLTDTSDILFSDCEAAVAPYLSGDLATAAQMLDEAGWDQVALQIRAELHRQNGDLDQAAIEFERAGQIEAAAELHSQADNFGESAALFERAGEFSRAGDLYRDASDYAAAGRCYEAAYDFDRAIESYRAIDRHDKVIELLEKTGEYLDAGTLCAETGDSARALDNLENVAFRDGGYFEARRRMAAILVEGGKIDLAIEKLGDAIAFSSEESVPMPLLDHLADLLEQAGRIEQALENLEEIRRREPHRAGLTDRIASLREQWQLQNPQQQSATATSAPTERIESRYEILGELGRGGMGVVLRARDRELGRLVALKRLPDNLRDHPKAVALFRREAQAAASLNHRNIVTIYDAGEEAGSYFITMELLEGMALNAILKRRRRIKPADVAKLGIQISAGLSYAHAQRIVHRDIKTANLFLTKERIVKIMDFGLAKTLEQVRRDSTVIGGTPYFMAPEQAIGGDLDHRADLYAFGVTLFHLATGTVPFTDGDLTYHHLHTPAPDPREIDADIPAELAALIGELLAKDPADRPADADAVSIRLQRLLGNPS